MYYYITEDGGVLLRFSFSNFDLVGTRSKQNFGKKSVGAIRGYDATME